MRAGILAGVLASTVPASWKSDTLGSPIVVHRKVGSEACELVQHGAFIPGKGFAWVEIEGENVPVYSPELGPGDYLSASPEVSRRAGKDAHKAGFELKREDSIPGDIPLVRRLQGNANCPDLRSSFAEVEQSRALRRSQLQAKVYRPESDDIIAATPLREPPPKSDATPNTPTSLPDTKQRAKYHGTVVLSVVIGTEGTVEQTHVCSSRLTSTFTEVPWQCVGYRNPLF